MHDSMHMHTIGAAQDLPLAQAYIPMQEWGEVYSPEEGTKKGTAFPCLYRPYNEMKGSGNNG